MCPRCNDSIVTRDLVNDVIAYDERPDADTEFVQVLRSAFRAEVSARAVGTYPPVGHTFPRYEDE